MEEIKDFDSFYDIKLQPAMNILKMQKKHASKWGIAAIVAFTLIVFSFVIEQTITGVICIILTVVCIYQYTKAKDTYVDSFKETIVKEIIDYLNPGMIYKPSKYVSSKAYKASGLFRHHYDYYDGDDYLEGTYKNVSFHCSELHTRYDSAGIVTYKSEPTIFKGLFFIASINRSFRGGTYVWQREGEQLPASVMDESYRLIPLPHVYRVKMQNDQFEKYFTVCSTNPAEARAILNPPMMEHMVKFRTQLGRKITFSFVAGKCYVAIPIKEDLFEPADEPDDREEIKNYFFSILLILSIINQLHLNKLT